MKKIYILCLASIISSALFAQSTGNVSTQEAALSTQKKALAAREKALAVNKAALSAKAKKNALKAIETFFASMLPINFLVDGISADRKGQWDNAFNEVSTYVKTQRALLFENKDITYDTSNFLTLTTDNLKSLGNQLITTIDTLRKNNSDFEKTKYAQINLKLVQDEVAKLVAHSADLKALENKLEAPDSNNKADDIKDVLHKLALNLRHLLEKLNGDLKKIAPDIDAAQKQQFLEKSTAAVSEFQRLSDEVVNAANVFAVDNIFKQGISADAESKWKNTMNKVGDYIKNNLSKPRSFGQGITASNQKLIKDAWVKISQLYINIPNTIKEARQKNADFKAIAGLVAAKIDWISVRIDDFMYKAQDIVDMRKALKPTLASKVSDILDVKNMKSIEDKILGILYEVIQKMKKDWCAIINKVTNSYARGMKSGELCSR